MAKRPTPHQYRLASFALVALCIVLCAFGRIDDAAVSAGCVAAVTLGR